MMSSAVLAKSGSARDAPTATPWARRKVLAMAPPMISLSTLATRLVRTGILVETLAPPITAATGRAGLSRTLRSASISSIISGPAQAGSRREQASVAAGVREEAVGARLTV